MIDMHTDAAPGPGPVQGLIHSLKDLVGSVLAIVQTRLELLTNDVQEEVHRVAELLLWAFIGLLAAGIGLLLAALVVIFAFWDTHRLLAAICVASAFFVLAGAAVAIFMSKLKSKPRLLNATLNELDKDHHRMHETP
jgi:uncharacterized membrane protein YqjE